MYNVRFLPVTATYDYLRLNGSIHSLLATTGLHTLTMRHMPIILHREPEPLRRQKVHGIPVVETADGVSLGHSVEQQP